MLRMRYILLGALFVAACANEPATDSNTFCAVGGQLAACDPGSYTDDDGVVHAFLVVCDDAYELSCDEGAPNTATGEGAFEAVCETEPEGPPFGDGVARCPDGSVGYCVDIPCDGETHTP